MKIIGVTVGTPLSPSFIKEKLNPVQEKVIDLEKAVADLQYVAIDIASFTNNVGTVETGSTVNEVTLNWTLNKEPSNQTLNNEAVDVAVRSKKLTGLAIRANETFTLAVEDERGATDSADTKVTFTNGVYHGVLESGAGIDSAAILGLTRKLQNSKALTFTVNAGATQRIAYAIPTRLGTPNFNVGGFDGGFAKVNTLNFTNASGYTESYDVWMSENVGLGNTTVKAT